MSRGQGSGTYICMYTNMIPVYNAAGHMTYACSARRYAMCRFQMSWIDSSTIPEAPHRGLLNFLSNPINTKAATSQTRQSSRSKSSSPSLGSRNVPWLGEASACRLQVVSPPLGWSPLSYFLVIWYPSGDTRYPSVVIETVGVPCPGPYHFSHIAD